MPTREQKGTGGYIVVLRGLVGFCIAFFTPVSGVFVEAARFHYWPERVQIVSAACMGLVAGFTAVAMFLDGSFTRWMQSPSPASAPDASATPPAPVKPPAPIATPVSAPART